jgi:choline-sulfatase
VSRVRQTLAFTIIIAALSPPGTAQTPPRLRPNILLVTIDTLRADRLGSYGYSPARTPNLDRLAKEGIRFNDATAHAALTFPSHSAILTGRYPGAFGIRLNGVGALPASATTIAEILKEASYRTGAVVASAVLDDGYGLSQGFDEYDDRIAIGDADSIALTDLQRTADQVTARAQQWLAAQPAGAPWFLWVHYYDPHLPYSAPAAFATLAPNRPYDAEIAFTDAQLGLLLARVDRLRTAVIVTGDHGESLGDHGEEDHGLFLYDSTLTVPLIVVAPGVQPRVVPEQVRHIDIAPTIAALAGTTLPAEDGSDGGESLMPLLTGGSRPEVPVSIAESWYPRLHFGWSELKSARVGEWKYIAAPRPELYDLRVDRAEAKNVAGDRGQVAGRLAADLSRITGRFGQKAPVKAEQLDPAAVERLQALGYLGAFAPVAGAGAGDDPKDHIAEYRQYRESFNRALLLLGKGNFAEAAAQLQRIVKLNVRAFEAHLYLGNAYAGLGKTDAALGEYDAATQLNPALATPHIEAAKVLANRKEYAPAIIRARKALELSPQSDYASYTLGVVYRRAGQSAEAADAFMRAIELNPMNVRARAGLGAEAMRLGRVDVARTQFEQLVQLGYQVAPSQFNLGIIAAAAGDRAEAERRFRLALKADPQFKPALDALAKLKSQSP